MSAQQLTTLATKQVSSSGAARSKNASWQKRGRSEEGGKKGQSDRECAVAVLLVIMVKKVKKLWVCVHREGLHTFAIQDSECASRYH